MTGEQEMLSLIPLQWFAMAKCQYLCATSELRTGTGLPLDRYMQKSCDLPLNAEVFGLLAIYPESVLILYDALHDTVRGMVVV